MENEFTRIMSQQTDEQLIKIVTVDRDNYQHAAIEAAEREIAKRKIDTLKVEEVRANITTKLEEETAFDESKVSSWIRLLHYIVDTFAFILLSLILGIILDFFYRTDDQMILNLVGFTLLAVSFFAYYIVMENKYQKTLGKFLTKTRVVTRDGQRALVGDIIRRTLCRLIPLDNFSYLFTRNGFHDKLSNTTVVRDRNNV